MQKDANIDPPIKPAFFLGKSAGTQTPEPPHKRGLRPGDGGKLPLKVLAIFWGYRSSVRRNPGVFKQLGINAAEYDRIRPLFSYKLPKIHGYS